MNFSTLKTYLTCAKAHAPKGPFAFIFAHDDIELTHTVAHHIKLGFRKTVVLADIPIARPEDLPAEVAFIPHSAPGQILLRYQPRDECRYHSPAPTLDLLRL